MSKIINALLLQWFFIRLFSVKAERTPKHWGILYWIVPFTGMGSKVKSLGKVKYWYFN